MAATVSALSPASCHRRRQRGTTLLEALITVLVLGLAGLAYAALQVLGVSSNASAAWRSQATVLAAEMADRMRGNPAGVAAGAYNSLTSPGTALVCSLSVPCTAAQMATTDFANWRSTLARVLPGGSGQVCRVNLGALDTDRCSTPCDASGDGFAIKVSWTEPRNSSCFFSVVQP